MTASREKCLHSLFIPINNSETFSIYISDQKPMLFSFDRNVLFEVSNIHMFISPFQNVFLFPLMPRSYHIAPHLYIDVLHKNYILDLSKMTMGYSVQIVKKLQWNRFALSMPLRGSGSPVAPFSRRAVKSYGKEKYSVIHFSYSLIIHYFNSKEL